MLEFLPQGEYWISRFILQRALGAIYLIAYLVALNQFRPLVGENGLLPATRLIRNSTFWETPSLFHWHYSDRFFGVVAWTGVLLSLVALTGLSDFGPIWLSMTIWFLLWALYLSIVNVGRTFYGFGWESILLEAGFYAIFLGPAGVATPIIVIFLFRWLLFRVEFGAGLIKMRGDRCWKELTCMNYHHETQPLPNPLSRFFHHMPESFHKFETFSNHLVQLVIVWGLFAPQPIASIAAILIILTQSYLIISGNYAWLNLLTLILAFSAFSDPVITQYTGLSLSETATSPLWFEIIVVLLGLLVIYLSIDPIRNMISSHQRMNFSFNPYHLVNTYGAFGTVTKKRYEIILEGTTDQSIDDDTQWKPYEFKGKPGDPHRLPPQIAPYHLRLDWQMWFAAMSSYHAHPWFLRLVGKLLDNDQQTVKLLKENPFENKAPTYIRARLYHYAYSSPEEKKETGRWWRRSYQKDYLKPVTRESLNWFGL